MDKCHKCGYEHFGFTHCLQTFWFIHDYYGDEWQSIGALNFEEAAEKIGEQLNEEEPTEGEIVESVKIANFEKSEIQYFSVSATLEFRYEATKLKIIKE